ncbi:MAG: 2-C-methyl-D-erythritol 4-phosphate cytidylyltransferase [bacterium]|nr:2-C-methyl-D-erythritol 4-phosphate cytidylyltransferase [bacterium]MCP4800187.1 2-C-methyl-D-erythritol 4-phosphate cytidylyltransferase [bacterium]
MRVHLIILAGGSGSRARLSESERPKQYQRLDSRMVLQWSIDEFSKSGNVVSTTVVASSAYYELLQSELPYEVNFAPAGETRTGSTWNALQMIDAEPDDLVAVHDAARPFATIELFEKLAEKASECDAAVPGITVPDTTIQVIDNKVDYLNRSHLRAVQTPQLFKWESFYSAHKSAAESDKSYSDDGSLMAANGVIPHLVEGEEGNWKVTTSADLSRARLRAVEILS